MTASRKARASAWTAIGAITLALFTTIGAGRRSRAMFLALEQEVFARTVQASPIDDFSSPASHDDASEPVQPTLPQLVAEYLMTDAVIDRARLGKIIREDAHDDINHVAKALNEAQVWQDVTPTTGPFTVNLAPDGEARFFYQLPDSYAGTKAYPLLVQMPADDVVTNGIQDSPFSQVLADVIVVVPTRPIAGRFHRTAESAGDVGKLLRALRERFHVDPGRIYLEGTGTGGNAAWMLAVSAPDQFAGVAVRGGCLDVPFRKQVYPLLISNLGNLPFLNLWMSPELPGSKETQKVVAVCNRAIKNIASQDGLSITSIEAAAIEDDAMKAFDPYRELATSSRTAIPPRLSHWFRYPEQGRCAWLRQTRFAGEVWTAEQLSILPGPEVDADEYITDVLKSLLAYLGGTIEGNTIRIETRRCAEIELLLYENMVDFSKPVVVYINGKKRHERIVKPSLPTLLEEVYETFDFQRLVFAKLTFSIKEDSTGPTGQ